MTLNGWAQIALFCGLVLLLTRPLGGYLDDEQLATLDQLANALSRDRSFLLNEAVGNYLDLHRWQIEEIRQAVAEADAGDFASQEDVRAAFDAFKAPAGR